ncbi:hypothetical protein PMIN05_008128 [Paraphaeosphaeria minitans]
MFGKFSSIAVLFMCVANAVSEDTEFKLFAYGKLASLGLQLFYGDGQAYVGGTPSFVKESVNISLVMAEGGDVFVAKANTTGPIWSTEPTMVKWNAASTKASDGIPISLRTQAPVALDDN